MDINKWLCKHFDEGDTGYVTIADIIFNRYTVSGALVLIVFFVVGSVLASIQNMPELQNDTLTLKGFFVMLLTAWVRPIIIITIAVVVIRAIHKISQIKVAKCPLKKEDE